MGIGNDIKPKKVYHFRNEKPSKPVMSEEIKKPDEKDLDEWSNFALSNHKKDENVEINEIKSDDLERLENDFFEEDKHIHKQHENHPKNDKVNAKTFIWIVLFIIAVLVIYQNFDSIKQLIKKNETGNVSTKDSSDDEYYTGSTGNSNRNTNANTNTNSVAATNTNTNTSAPQNANTNASPTTIDKAAIKMRVLNGSGKTGMAEQVSNQLKLDDFAPTNVGNAQKFTYQETYIYYKTGKSAEAELVKSSLSKRTCVTEESNEITGTYDIVVVVGKQ